jgi:gamma-glutamylaminecyclotransferase
MATLFVFGTLKCGFANYRPGQGTPVLGKVGTVQRYPLRIVGRYKIPWLLNAPGQGLYVSGELFTVDQQMLGQLDRVEGVHHPGWFKRSRIWVRVRKPQGCRLVRAWVYFGSERELAKQGATGGFLCEFGSEHNLEYLRNAG